MVHRLIVRRQRFKQALTLKERLLRSANESSKRAAVMPPGADRRKLLKWAQIALLNSTSGFRHPDLQGDLGSRLGGLAA